MSAPSRDEIAQLVMARLSEVVAAEPSTIRETARFEEDLAADSLDRIEVIEAVEADLRSRGAPITLPDDVIESMRTVRDAVERVHAHAADQPAAP